MPTVAILQTVAWPRPHAPLACKPSGSGTCGGPFSAAWFCGSRSGAPQSRAGKLRRAASCCHVQAAVRGGLEAEREAAGPPGMARAAPMAACRKVPQVRWWSAAQQHLTRARKEAWLPHE